MQTVVLTARQDDLAAFAQGLDMDILWMDSGLEIVQAARTATWALVVVDGLMPGLDYKKFLIDLLTANAMLNTVVITDLSDHDFHEESEGLGVLRALPSLPGFADGQQVFRQLADILGF
ncbi:MAG: hypothetical protein RBR42_09355 [Desulfomicrobium sp.]|nr:hypothetical protein [Desulfomicrobium sp.]NLV97714.1 hypothetical protein [Desulfovibrionales bacterium]